jgi:hypothetical protein
LSGILARVKSLATVLIAEEKQSLAAELRSTIHQHRAAWPVMTVADGDQALAYLRGMARAARSAKFPITPLLFLSLTIPEVSALQILDWVKRQFALRTLIITLLCGIGEIPEFGRLTRYGARAAVNKTALAGKVPELLAAVENERPITHPLALALAASESRPSFVGLSTHAASIAHPQLQADRDLLTSPPPMAI